MLYDKLYKILVKIAVYVPDRYPRQCYFKEEPVGLLWLNNYCSKMVLVVVGYRKMLRIAMTLRMLMLYRSVTSK